VTPYYQDEAVTIYHGDCREVLGAIALRADVLLTDPPYGVDFAGKTTKHTAATGGYTTPDSDIGPEIVARLLPSVQRAAIFTGIRLMFQYPAPRDIGCIYCPSGAGRGPWGFGCFNPLLYYGQAPPASRLSPASIHSFAMSDEDGHPCPKPRPWLAWALQRVSLEGEVVLDPFCGSGTTLEAAKRFGRIGLGIEIEERYCELAANRCRQGALRFADASENRAEALSPLLPL
jgi:site-specific DNA-methyltransferase (adenine-specific)